MSEKTVPANYESQPCPGEDARECGKPAVFPNIGGLTREQRFMGTVYAINTLLQLKGVYSGDEFAERFNEWAKGQK